MTSGIASSSYAKYTKAYIGDIVDGKIIGTVPQYIKEVDGEFYPVTSMSSTFFQCDLTQAPEIPSTVTNMEETFYFCFRLTKAPIIPEGVINMKNTFYSCSSLTQAPEIPSTVTNMEYTFYSCIRLTGDLVINANPSNYICCLLNVASVEGTDLKLTGTSTMLEELLNTKSSDSNITIKGIE